MNIAWTKHLKTQEEREEFRKYLKGSTKIFNRQRDIINESIEEMNRVESSIKDFDTPSWAVKQAYRNGARAYARQMLNLIDFDKKEYRPNDQ